MSKRYLLGGLAILALLGSTGSGFAFGGHRAGGGGMSHGGGSHGNVAFGEPNHINSWGNGWGHRGGWGYRSNGNAGGCVSRMNPDGTYTCQQG